MTEARVDFIPTRTNKILSATARINALINYLWKKKQETDISVFLEEQKLVQLQFHMSTRKCQHIMREDGILSREVQEEELSSLGEAESSVAASPPRRNMRSHRIYFFELPTNATRKTHFFAVFFSSSYYIIHSQLPFTKYSQYFDFNYNYLKLLMNILELYTTLEQDYLNVLLIEKHQQL
ncbi:hypothetical protein F4703DRAFT_1791231 [Phycomyces blakesleeanus]